MEQNWSGKTGGTYRMQRALVWLFRHTSLRFVYGITHFWIVWYILVRPTVRHGAYLFHRRRGRNRLQASVDVYRSFYSFAKAIMDRFAVYAGYEFDIKVKNPELYYDRKVGFVMLFSHVGNTEMAGYFLKTPDKRLHILAYGGESPVVMAHRAKVLELNNIDMITIYPNDMSHIYRINDVLQAGDILAFGADRLMGEKAIATRFMGSEAKLPAGAFQICASMKHPVLLVFVIKDSDRDYHVYCEELKADSSLPRQERAQQLADQYAERLEQMALRYPYQWFNFYDFWQK